MSRSLLFLLIIAFLAFNCSKKGSTATPADSPSVITINAPVTGVFVTNGSSLNISGDMTDNNALVSTKVEIKNKNTGTVYNTQSANTGNVTFYHFSWNWTVTGITTLTPAVVRVTSKDRYGYEVFSEVEITLDN
jgi:hypothetical protein